GGVEASPKPVTARTITDSSPLWPASISTSQDAWYSAPSTKGAMVEASALSSSHWVLFGVPTMSTCSHSSPLASVTLENVAVSPERMLASQPVGTLPTLVPLPLLVPPVPANIEFDSNDPPGLLLAYTSTLVAVTRESGGNCF